MQNQTSIPKINSGFEKPTQSAHPKMEIKFG